MEETFITVSEWLKEQEAFSLTDEKQTYRLQRVLNFGEMSQSFRLKFVLERPLVGHNS